MRVIDNPVKIPTSIPIPTDKRNQFNGKEVVKIAESNYYPQAIDMLKQLKAEANQASKQLMRQNLKTNYMNMRLKKELSYLIHQS